MDGWMDREGGEEGGSTGEEMMMTSVVLLLGGYLDSSDAPMKVKSTVSHHISSHHTLNLRNRYCTRL